jgi:phosphoglycerate kinase
MSHLGRPNGQIDSKYSLAPIAADLQLHLPNRRIRFLNDCIGPITEEVCQTSEEGDVILLENLRFHPEEEGKLPKDEEGKTKKANKSSVKKFRASLSKLADIYVNDAFGTAHRAHASITGINLPLKATGLLLQKELEYFAKVLESPEPPFLAIIGGAKLSDKIQLIEKMSDKVNSIILCGGMAFTFLKACKNMKIGDSLHDNNCEELARNLMEKAQEKNVKILLPIDFVTAPSAKASDHTQAAGYATDKEGIPEGMKGLDCGQESSQLFHDEILRSRTILWNGPPGVFELEEHFSKGTKTMLASMIEATEKGATTIIGGGG